MFNGQRVLAIIPARSGSKGLPGKNIKLLNGKPLIGWTIDAAISSLFIDEVIVSTDGEEIAEISKKFGAKVPFLRPKDLAGDDSPRIDAILHCIDFLKSQNDVYDLVVYLQPTSPLRLASDIDSAIEMLDGEKMEAVISVCEVEHPPFWSNTIPKDGCIKNFLRPEYVGVNRQDLDVCYRLNGAVFVSGVEYLKVNGEFWGEKTFAYKMPTERSVDIDTEIDFKIAEVFMREITHREFCCE